MYGESASGRGKLLKLAIHDGQKRGHIVNANRQLRSYMLKDAANDRTGAAGGRTAWIALKVVCGKVSMALSHDSSSQSLDRCVHQIAGFWSH